MADQTQDKPVPLFNLADRVKIRLSGGMRGRIVELRGPLGPAGSTFIESGLWGAVPTYIELMEDQIRLVPAKVQFPPGIPIPDPSPSTCDPSPAAVVSRIINSSAERASQDRPLTISLSRQPRRRFAIVRRIVSSTISSRRPTSAVRNRAQSSRSSCKSWSFRRSRR